MFAFTTRRIVRDSPVRYLPSDSVCVVVSVSSWHGSLLPVSAALEVFARVPDPAKQPRLGYLVLEE